MGILTFSILDLNNLPPNPKSMHTMVFQGTTKVFSKLDQDKLGLKFFFKKIIVIKINVFLGGFTSEI
jgi:hypothetical protein